ncbi:hypothetical protein [Nonomuraea harbinensis]|uniref:Uncharacterized protein n=1 Tax=Nonomuraea harbinensis TaxID=1286938 RepID=A0ABW1C8P5_9ACTN|nr:hypothetical protein [Nonomuraea harbinensis]
MLRKISRAKLIAIGAALTVLVAGLLVVGGGDETALGFDTKIVDCGEGQWKRDYMGRLQLDPLHKWPTRGNRTGDQDLLKRARAAILKALPDLEAVRLRLLYAGEEDNEFPERTVLALDMDGYRLLTFTTSSPERESDPGRVVVRAADKDDRPAGLIKVSFSDYLLPPCVTSVEKARLDAKQPEWKQLPMNNGLINEWWLEEPDPNRLVDGDRVQGDVLKLHRGAQTVTVIPAPQTKSRSVEEDFDHTDQIFLEGVEDLGADDSWRDIRDLAFDRRQGFICRKLWTGNIKAVSTVRLFTCIDEIWGIGRSRDRQAAAVILESDGFTLAPVDSGSGVDAYGNVAAVWIHARNKRWHLVAAGGPATEKLDVGGSEIEKLAVSGEINKKPSREFGVLASVPADADPESQPPAVVVIATDETNRPVAIKPAAYYDQ